jgi:hypothetical protein
MSSITGSTGATGYTGATGFTGATGSQGPGLFTLKSFDNNIYFTNNNATKITSTSSFSFFSSVEVYQYCVLSFTINKVGNSVTNFPKFMSLSTLPQNFSDLIFTICQLQRNNQSTLSEYILGTPFYYLLPYEWVIGYWYRYCQLLQLATILNLVALESLVIWSASCLAS